MNARNRKSEVTQLIGKTCQDFLKMIIKPSWQEELYIKAAYEVNNNTPHKVFYAEVYEKMRN